MIIGSIFTLLTVNAYAGYSGNHTISGFFGADTIKFGVDNRTTSDTCAYWGRHFKFDATTAAGKNILSILLAAKMANKKITVWYTASTAPGTTESNGCNPNTMATINEIGFTD